MCKTRIFLSALFLSLACGQASAETIRVAVASNFIPAMKELTENFEAISTHNITLIAGSTGKHYAQIKNGAPYDVFFAADITRPELLENENIAISGSRFTYAIGKILLWSPDESLIDAEASTLMNENFRFLALANPKLAPYGLAAKEVLEQNGSWLKLQDKLVRGENISQTLQFILSGNAQLGFIAQSQFTLLNIKGSSWLVPQHLYTPIQQQAITLTDSPRVKAFINYIQSEEGQAIIERYGYDTL